MVEVRFHTIGELQPMKICKSWNTKTRTVKRLVKQARETLNSLPPENVRRGEKIRERGGTNCVTFEENRATLGKPFDYFFV